MKRSAWLAFVAVAFAASSGCGEDEDKFVSGSGGHGGSASGGRGGASGSGGAAGASTTGGGAGTTSEAGEGGVGNAASLGDEDDLRAWANMVSALGVYLNVYQPFAVADGQDVFLDPTCPVTTDDGTTIEIEGGCTDTSGAEWVGSAVVVRQSGGELDLTFNQFGTRQGGSVDLRDGLATRLAVDDTSYDFSLDLEHRTADATATFDYFGTVTGDYDTRSVWAGTGVVTREGASRPVGTVDATTTEEVVDDDACSGQPASGNTVITSSGDTVVVTYDGSVDCDDMQAASYTRNGGPRQIVTGIVCSLSHGSATENPVVILGVLGIAAALGARRRRR